MPAERRLGTRTLGPGNSATPRTLRTRLLCGSAALLLAALAGPAASAGAVYPIPGVTISDVVGEGPAGTASRAHTAGTTAQPESSGEGVRVAVYNVSLVGEKPGQIAEALADRGSAERARAQRIAKIIEQSGSDVVVLTGIDVGGDGAGQAFSRLLPAEYRHTLELPVNSARPVDPATGAPEPSADPAQPASGDYPGQGGMVVVSKLPLDSSGARSFSSFLWKDLPGATLPDDPSTPEPGDYYSEETRSSLRLLTSAVWDVPVLREGRRLHVIAANLSPVSPDADRESPEALRHVDELRFLQLLLTPGSSDFVYDDDAAAGGFSESEPYVVAASLGSDPRDSGAASAETSSFLSSDAVRDLVPTSAGGTEASDVQGGANASHLADSGADTADLSDTESGNLRLDYVLPAPGVESTASGVFWPGIGERGSELTGVLPGVSSPYRLVWADVE